MTDAQQLGARADRLGRTGTPERGLTYLAAVASTLADWGGKPAREILEAALPKGVLSARLGKGRSHAKAKALRPDASGDTLLQLEVARRAGELDPAKAGIAIRPILGLIREQLAPGQLEQLVATLPPDVGAELADSTMRSPYPYRLIPQSYARPRR